MNTITVFSWWVKPDLTAYYLLLPNLSLSYPFHSGVFGFLEQPFLWLSNTSEENLENHQLGVVHKCKTKFSTLANNEMYYISWERQENLFLQTTTFQYVYCSILCKFSNALEALAWSRGTFQVWLRLIMTYFPDHLKKEHWNGILREWPYLPQIYISNAKGTFLWNIFARDCRHFALKLFLPC